MIRPPARSFTLAAAGIALCAPLSAPLAAQQQSPSSFRLPEPTPSPTPAPAGPADERAGVVIPPGPVARPRIAPVPVLTPEPLPQPSPRSTQRASEAAAVPRVQPGPTTPAARAPAAPVSTSPVAAPTAPAPTPAPAPAPAPGDRLALPPAPPVFTPEAAVPAPAPTAGEEISAALPAWWPWAAGGLGALVLLAGGALLWRQRKPKALRLAAPASQLETDAPAEDLPRLDLALEIAGATRSVMMFKLQYRLTIANRSDRAVSDLAIAVQLACARASAAVSAGNAPSPGAAQRTGQIERIGPHQARTFTGEVQLPLAAIVPFRQGMMPLFVPLVHVTLEGEGQRALARSFVIGTPSTSGAGRVHPIPLDKPPGTIAGLVAQSVAIPAHSAAA